MEDNLALCKAIDEENIEIFLDLLHRPGVDLNYKDENGHTPLTVSIRKPNHLMAKHLIEAGCDVNVTEAYSKYTPLHLIVYPETTSNELLQALIERGANINAQHRFDGTPLYMAVALGNLEATCALLYYGADIPITQTSTSTYNTIFCHNETSRRMLLDYYDDFSNKDSYGNLLLHVETWGESSIVFDLIERGADVNCLDNTGRCLLYATNNHKNAKFFKFIWSRMDHQLLVKSNSSSPPFLLEYLEEWCFSQAEFLECLYLMLESPFACDLVENCNNYTKFKNSRCSFVQLSLKMFVFHEIPLQDVLSIIHIYLSLGAKINMYDLRYTCENYGSGEVFKTLVYGGDFNCKNFVNEIRYCKKLEEDFYLKGFSSFSLDNKRHAKEINSFPASGTVSVSNKFLEPLEDVPKFPSLVELSRNQAQEFIQQNFGITKLYQFYDVVAHLKLPPTMKAVLLLEMPIYDYSESTLGLADSDNEDVDNYSTDAYYSHFTSSYSPVEEMFDDYDCYGPFYLDS